LAYDGVIASMVTERWPALARTVLTFGGLACAGAADASPAARLADTIAAGTANTAVLRRVRLRFAVSKPRTPGMLVS
jgi:aspartate oxidase